jgi:hypothetical protein
MHSWGPGVLMCLKALLQVYNSLCLAKIMSMQYIYSVLSLFGGILSIVGVNCGYKHLLVEIVGIKSDWVVLIL